MIPPKPPARPDRVSLWRHLRLFRADILSSQPARLFRAWMAEFRTPFFRSYLCNDPDLIDRVLRDEPDRFPKSARIAEGLRPLLGRSVFLTNGEDWQRQRRIIDPAFEGGRLRTVLPSLWEAAIGLRDRLAAAAVGEGAGAADGHGGPVEVEAETSHAAADAIFRALFSVPISDADAAAVFQEFRTFQRSQPLLNAGAFLPLPGWVPRGHRPGARRAAARIRARIHAMTLRRQAEIAAGRAPQDLATRLMTTPDPRTGVPFDADEMVDQVAIFFLAGHETSASALAWALWLVAGDAALQDRLAAEAAAALPGDAVPDFEATGRLALARDVFREALRLYPPVPMMVRETTCPMRMRDRAVPRGAQIVLSPWHLHRHEALWDAPDAFDPGRWSRPEGRASARRAYLPFSAGPRVCPGAGFAMLEGPLMLALVLRDLRLATVADRLPEPVAHLTLRSRSGIWLAFSQRHPAL